MALVRTYRGHQQSDAVTVFSEDAKGLAHQGSFPASKTWEPGRWGWRAGLVPLLLVGFFFWSLMSTDQGLRSGRVTPAQASSNMLFIILLVVIGFIAWGFAYYMMKPDGTLTVTYERRAESDTTRNAVPAPAANVEARLATLEWLRSTGAITKEEYAARRSKILNEI